MPGVLHQLVSSACARAVCTTRRLRPFEPAFVIAEEIAGTPGMLDNLLQALEQAFSRRGRRRGGAR